MDCQIEKQLRRLCLAVCCSVMLSACFAPVAEAAGKADTAGEEAFILAVRDSGNKESERSRKIDEIINELNLRLSRVVDISRNEDVTRTLQEEYTFEYSKGYLYIMEVYNSSVQDRYGVKMDWSGTYVHRFRPSDVTVISPESEDGHLRIVCRDGANCITYKNINERTYQRGRPEPIPRTTEGMDSTLSMRLGSDRNILARTFWDVHELLELLREK